MFVLSKTWKILVQLKCDKDTDGDDSQKQTGTNEMKKKVKVEGKVA